MRDGYHINVSKMWTSASGNLVASHYLHVELGNCANYWALQVLDDLRTRFPEAENFKCDMTLWQSRGVTVDH